MTVEVIRSIESKMLNPQSQSDEPQDRHSRILLAVMCLLHFSDVF
jgi:hypothetical protein